MSDAALSQLSAWINELVRSPTPAHRNHLARTHRETLELAEQIGVFVSAGRADRWTCADCEVGYSGGVQYSPDRGWTRQCLCRGEQPIKPEELDLVRLDRRGLLTALAKACGGSYRQADSSPAVVRLAEVTAPFGSGVFTIAYADGLDSSGALARLMSGIQASLKADGVVVTPSRLTTIPPLPKRYKLMPLERAFRVGPRGLQLDLDAIDDRLASVKLAPGKPGPRSPIEHEKRLWLGLRSGADWPATATAQAILILRHWPVGGPKPNKAETIAGHIGRHQSDWLQDSETAGEA